MKTLSLTRSSASTDNVSLSVLQFPSVYLFVFNQINISTRHKAGWQADDNLNIIMTIMTLSIVPPAAELACYSPQPSGY